MSLELAQKGLTLVDSPVTWKRKIHEAQHLGDVIKQYMKDSASLVVWQRQQISWGRWDGSSLVFANQKTLDENQILEIRVFNENEELHLYRRHGAYEGRYVCDGEGSVQSHVDALSRLWGHKTNHDGNFATLKDDERFLSMTVPCQEKADYYGLVTRSYIEADAKTGQAGYTDYRFVRIESAEGGR
ncbi:CRISPR-associated protein Csx19 [Megasphaera massiliensis]|uniref:type III-D CRISPR-associated protein Csx19 n=1 Tax=Megasphaera massiliensis TaxID=1232428 RepID=UPI0021099ED2|nr:CRISPR-associated protein Csx19 [Megasphaera massiliensis]MCQ5209282.1 CRISPR-associated protein Csx19 [Megasphaera massiliensis]